MMGLWSTPGYLEQDTKVPDFKSTWVNLIYTIPFFDGTLYWDLMPGIAYHRSYGEEEVDVWAFNYSSRLAIYKVIPQSAIVVEAFGAKIEGGNDSEAQYKAGVRWESQSVVVALTYGAGLDGSDGGGIEFGILFITPPFLCKTC